VSGQHHALAALLPLKEPWHNEYRLDGPVGLSKRFGEEKNILLPLTCIKMWFIQVSGFQSVLCESQGIWEWFPADSWIHFCNGCYEVYLFLN
jgi:hypothetical protein